MVRRESSLIGAFGRGQIILTDENGVLTAGTEPRADSMAAVW